MSKVIDLTGQVFGRLTVISRVESSSRGEARWLCECACGNRSTVTTSRLRSRSTKSCGCLKAESGVATNTTHGMSNTKEYHAWESIKNRVFNHSHPGYAVYSKLGMDEDLAESFEAFYKEIGPCPADGQRYSVDRIDNTKGYVVGNIRWATYVQQARNRGMMSNNTSGVTGVSVQEKRSGDFHSVAQWCDLSGKPHFKSFSFKKYGEEEAFRLACEYRSKMIEELNKQGAGYSVSHGKSD